jgi:hypothetical protein
MFMNVISNRLNHCLSFSLLGFMLVALIGCSGAPPIGKNELAKQLEGTWVGSHNFGENPDGTKNMLWQKFTYTHNPTSYNHGTWTYQSSEDGNTWKDVGSGSWTVLPPATGPTSGDYNGNSSGYYDVRVERYMDSGMGESLFNDKKNRVFDDFTGTSYTDRQEGDSSFSIKFKKI